MSIISFGQTHIGQVRSNNQDSIYFNAENNLFIVADGMGGHKGGEVASKLAVDLIPEFIDSNKNKFDDISMLLVEAIKHTNQVIYNKASESEDCKGMGTTVTVAYFQGSNCYMANVGDSRIYLINNGAIFQMTKDHTLIQEKLNLGIYGRKEAQRDKMKNILVRTVGYELIIDVDIFNYKTAQNDLFLLCSDGLYGKICDSDIIKTINDSLSPPTEIKEDDLKKVTQNLIDMANNNGGQDNISVIIIMAQ